MEHLTAPPRPKILFWETNFAGKLGEQEFVHIARPPASPVSETTLHQQLFEIRTADGSHPPVRVRLNDFVRLPLSNINDKVAMRSHGLTAFELQKKLLSENTTFSANTMMAVYFYSAVAL